MALIRCPKCYTMTSDERETCPMCGTPLHEDKAAEEQAALECVQKQGDEAARRRKRKLTTLTVICSVLFVLAVAFTAYVIARTTCFNKATAYIEEYEFAKARQSVEFFGNFAEDLLLRHSAYDEIAIAIKDKVKAELPGGWITSLGDGEYLIFVFNNANQFAMYTSGGDEENTVAGTYTLTSDALTLINSDNGSVSYRYEMKKDMLTLSNDYMTLPMIRVDENAG